MAAEHVNDRSLLRFAEEVERNFSFLESLGFRRVRSEPTFVRFESPRANVNIYHGRRSFEIGLEIESPQDTYYFSEILRLVDPEEGERYRDFATRTKSGVAEGVGKLAECFQRCVAAGILDDKQLFARLQAQREKIARNYALEIQLLQARKRSEVAWRKKDYAAIIEALEPLRAALTASEIAKLEFAEKHL